MALRCSARLSLLPKTSTNRAIRSRFLSTPPSPASPPSPAPPFYVGPLAGTFKSLKLFSLGSFGLATALSPFIFIIESPMPTSARAALAVTAIATSGASTGLVAWCGAPYVGSMRKVPPSGREKPGEEGGVELNTKSAFLKDLRTVVKSTAFLGQTTRPFAKWELVKHLRAEADFDEGEGRRDGVEEILAETFDEDGDAIGAWVVSWRKALDDQKMVEGDARAEGRVVRYFNVHEELLSEPAEEKQ